MVLVILLIIFAKFIMMGPKFMGQKFIGPKFIMVRLNNYLYIYYKICQQQGKIRLRKEKELFYTMKKLKICFLA